MTSFANHLGDRQPHVRERFVAHAMTGYAAIAAAPMPCDAGLDGYRRQLAVLQRGFKEPAPVMREPPSKLKRIAASKQRQERFLATCEEKKAVLCAAALAVLKANGALSSGRLAALMDKHRTALLSTLIALEKEGKARRIGQQNKTQWVAA